MIQGPPLVEGTGYSNVVTVAVAAVAAAAVAAAAVAASGHSQEWPSNPELDVRA